MLSNTSLLFFFFLATLLPPSFAQAPQPAQTPQPAKSEVTTLRAGTQLVVVDVVVTDKSQNPILNLKASAFALLEGGKQQQIKSFEEHTAPTAKPGLPPIPAFPPGIFSNYTPVPTGGAVNVLLVDTLNTPVLDQIYLHDQFHKYLKTAKPGAPMAIFGLTTKLLLLQSFTSDPELLKAAINNKNIKNSPLIDRVSGGNSTLLSDQAVGFAAIIQGANASSDAPLGTPGGFQQRIIQDIQQFESQQNSFQLQLRAKYTLDAINQLARYLEGIPGRKNLIWFSGSFPLDILPDSTVDDPFMAVASSEDEYRETTNLLTRAQVAVYPIDVRGAMTSPNMDVSQSTAIYQDDVLQIGADKRFASDQIKFHLENGSENLTMIRMAEDSGGYAFINNNDLVGAVSKAVAAGSHYYTLTYSPTDTNWNGNFRKIQVKLQQSGVTLAYRRGYYANDPNVPIVTHLTNKTRKDSATAAPRTDPMRVAMMHGAPNPTEITLKARVLPAGTEPETELAKDNTLNPSSDTKGPYRRYAIDIAADPSSINIQRAPDGNYHALLQFLTYVYDQNDNLINVVSNPVRATYSPTVYRQILHTGIPYHEEISVPLKGAYFLRIGLHDLATNHIGAVEVPVDSVKKLSPITASALTESATPHPIQK
ncbi:VWA domain-containing protein [Tunturibacter psychrotolerans]|uniref:VWA domain-containing protein n=1 Tax=Tunturiibacter psychrotolerans TaxID=3069686 RepID=A0AAU7ZLN2_9BACT